MDYKELSKEVAYALRHNPFKYGLELDDSGFVKKLDLLEALKKHSKWKKVKENDLKEMIKSSEKKRYEIIGDKIRALYGHSVSKKIKKEEKEPPRLLYHGTARRFVNSIKKEGLLPKERQYVHLSLDFETAMEVGKRHDDVPVILEIDSYCAWKAGVKFYIGNDNIWLADSIPSEYIEEMD
ncbi:RNA 2'-phosphotransferase [Clostridium felsineum]|uniref:Probable RNA 2'-phosphotransferase n=1 Tax=Clostridium felsineum TaxID=36839 RepID=A0A1S8MCH7_9CLOT|nr:RNA 2'-phosphotransferase [Clostridium felsineum]URZ07326.1 putative RNA 2'-phosphotransferase [Clostridium felsineum]URZ12357.1 putative RNA 2'-phosphotransferase [Clostridium felsineum]